MTRGERAVRSVVVRRSWRVWHRPFFARVWLGFLAACSLLLVVLGPRTALADEPEISATVDTQRLGVGDVLRLTLRASSRGHRPSHPVPGITQGFSIIGTSSGPTSQVTITNGHMVSQQGLDTVWSLRANTVGTWSVGPVSVQVGAQTYRAGPVKITVVPAGQAPPHTQANPFDPFGNGSPFGGGGFDPFRGLLDSLGGREPADSHAADPKLAMDSPLGAVAFLHAVVDTTDVVVGEQVTVSMYLYVEGNIRDPGVMDVHEATAADFVKRTLFEDDTSDHGISRATVNGRIFNVRLLRKWALFPLKAGDLVVTPMEMTLQKNRSTGDPSRSSETLTIHVTEPPLAHRPPGYTLGDVGKFTLSSDVIPRDIEEDGAIGVTLTLDGTGNLPSMITPPAQAGLEWLAPEVHEKVGAIQGDHFGGSRTFAYVVRVHKVGDVNLGWIRLPFWDPVAKRYDTARTDLGTVTVRPSATPKDKAETPPDPFSALPDVRAQMGHTHGPASTLAESHPTFFWLSLAATPFAFVVFSGASRAIQSVRERSAEKAASPETDLRAKLAAAEQANRGEDGRELTAATARAVESAIVMYADVTVRDARGGEARERLSEAGVTEDVASRVLAILAECEAARFSPDAVLVTVARARWKTAKEVIDALRTDA